MNETRELLMKDYKNNADLLLVTDPNTEKYDMLLSDRDNIRNEIIKLDSIEMDAKMQKESMKNENRKAKISNIIEITLFAINTGVCIWGVVETFKFDKEGTITSTLGRGILNCISLKSKR